MSSASGPRAIALPWAPMARRASRALLALVVILGAGACNKPEQGKTEVDSPGSSVAGTESAKSKAGGPATTLGDPGSGLARSLVAVTNTPLAEASPCERTCGRLGDCLFESEDYREFEARGLELECLDLCVYTPKDAAPRTALLGCEERQACGELIACAQTNWVALGELHEGPAVEGITASMDPCKAGCRWLYACMFSGAPPGEAYMDPAIEEQMRLCEKTCETLDARDREAYAAFASCLPSHCSPSDSTCYDYGH